MIIEFIEFDALVEKFDMIGYLCGRLFIQIFAKSRDLVILLRWTAWLFVY